jgi:hypothetical protein
MTSPIMAASNHNFVPVLVQLAMFHEIHRSPASGLVIGGVHRCIIVFIDIALRSGIVDVSVVAIISGNTAIASVHRL